MTILTDQSTVIRLSTDFSSSFFPSLCRVQEGRESNKCGDHEWGGFQLPSQTRGRIYRNYMCTCTYIFFQHDVCLCSSHYRCPCSLDFFETTFYNVTSNAKIVKIMPLPHFFSHPLLHFQIVAFKPDIVITEKGVSDLAQHYFVKAGITAFRR